MEIIFGSYIYHTKQDHVSQIASSVSSRLVSSRSREGVECVLTTSTTTTEISIMSAFTTSFTGVRVVSKTTVAKKTVQTKAVASFENVKKVRDDG